MAYFCRFIAWFASFPRSSAVQALSRSLTVAQSCPKLQEYSQLASIAILHLLGIPVVPLEGKTVPTLAAYAFCRLVLDCTGNHRLSSHSIRKSTRGSLCSSKSRPWLYQYSRAPQHKTVPTKSSTRQLASYCCPQQTPQERYKDCSTAHTMQIHQGDWAYCHRQSEISRPFSWIDSSETSEWFLASWTARIASHLWSCAVWLNQRSTAWSLPDSRVVSRHACTAKVGLVCHQPCLVWAWACLDRTKASQGWSGIDCAAH